MFDSIPTYFRYRTLFVTTPMLQGEDVYALQTALNELNFPCGEADGILGAKTGSAIRSAQQKLFLVVDGKAGGDTQKALALALAERVAVNVQIPFTAFKGQLELESGYRLGIYSPPRDDGSYDAGVAQRNTNFTSPVQGFDTQASIRALGENTRKYYDLFTGLEIRRRWALAQGAWNAPAFACYFARQEGAPKVTAGMTARPSDAARIAFENYVTQASVYLT
jgi:hypothetical protein